MNRGFTLLELLVAVSLAAVVTTAAVVVTMSIYRSMSALEKHALVDEEAKLVVDYLTQQTLQVGGGAVRPWEALSISCTDGVGMPACTGAEDRLHVLQVDDTVTSCIIHTYNGIATALTAEAPGGVCCMDSWGGPEDVAIVPSTPGGGHQVRRCAPTGGCVCLLSPIPGATDVAPLPGVTIPPLGWHGGTVAPARQVSLYLDRANHSLMQRADLDGDGTYEDVVVSDRVHDFQVQLGYDSAPNDGVLDVPWEDTLDLAKAVDLRMARIGVVIGVPTPSRASPSSASLFGAAPVTVPRGVSLRAASGTVALRNVLVFF